MITPPIDDAVPFAELAAADLIADGEYLGGSQGSMANDPIARLLPMGTLGGSGAKGIARCPAWWC
ncbi:MAG: hypothetical protein ACM3ML_08090 [Micromonosporaceae bacterium]